MSEYEDTPEICNLCAIALRFGTMAFLELKRRGDIPEEGPIGP